MKTAPEYSCAAVVCAKMNFEERVFEFAGPLPDDRANDGHHVGVEIIFGGEEWRCPAMIETRIH